MKSNLDSKLSDIVNYPFFEAVGGPLPRSVTKVENWQLAVESCTDTKWKNCRLMARNALQGLTEERAWERGEQWNFLADQLRPRIVLFIDTLLVKAPISREIGTKIRDALHWDLMFICLEYEYRDVVDPFFYVPLVDHWYAAGHFPCGWDGKEFPDDWDGVIRDGRLMVF